MAGMNKRIGLLCGCLSLLLVISLSGLSILALTSPESHIISLGHPKLVIGMATLLSAVAGLLSTKWWFVLFGLEVAMLLPVWGCQ
jgi:hypothetical protein